LTVMLLLAVFLPARVTAEGVRFNSEHLYNYNDSDTTIKDTGEKISSTFTRFDQRYNLDVSKTLYPYLVFATGTFYEHDKSTTSSEDLDVDSTEKTLRPFVELNLNNPIYQAGVTYRKTRIEEETTDLPDTRSNRDQFTATVGMTPSQEFPEWDFTFIRTLTSDNPETIDQKVDIYDFGTQYTPLPGLLLDYSYLRNETDDRLRNFDTTEQTHFGKAEYSNNFFGNRVSLNTAYRIRYNTFTFPGSATVEQPIPSVAGLSSLDNTPEDGPALSQNQALVDGNVTASAGLNIGTGGDQASQVNIGLDFGRELDVDQIRIWVDRRLTAAVADSFSWSIYTSPDNLNTSTWTLVATVAPAEFGTFDNRFEILFPTVNTRFIKAVTRPLAPTVIGAADFANIFVTEMEALITRSGVEVENEQKNVDHNFNFNIRGQVTEKTSVGYSLLYSLQHQEPLDEDRTQVTNDVFVSHLFNNVFSANANAQRTDISFFDEDTTDYTYGAALRAAWLQTFNQSLIYSGRYAEETAGNAYQNSVFLRNNAILYKGWSAYVDTGYSWERPADDPEITTTFVKGGTEVEPNRKINFNLNYSYKRTRQAGLDIGPSTQKEFNFQGFYIPFRNLSFFAQIGVLDRNGSRETFQNYNLNWSPFPDGDLQFFFVYSETRRNVNDQSDRVVGPSLKWTIGRHIFLDMSYTYNRIENDVQKTDSNVFFGDLKLVF